MPAWAGCSSPCANARRRQLGYMRAIHALMHEQNASRNLSRQYAHPMRGYALFGKALGARS